MANSISKSLDILRRNAMAVILSNTNVRFVGLQRSLNQYINNGSDTFKSFLHLMNFDHLMLSSSQVSASLLLSYMDFYAVYALMYSNYIPIFQNLKNISENKYAHIYNLYKGLNGLVKEKQTAQDYFFVLYSNFLYPNNIDILNSGLTNRGGKASKILSFDSACTLPIKKKKDILPSAISFFSSDGSVSINESESTLDSLRFEILRKQNNKIGAVNPGGVKVANESTTSIPDVDGTIFGYFANNIYIECEAITKDENSIVTSVDVIGSTNGFDWSDTFTINIGEPRKILIEDNIELGLNINFYAGMSVKAGDRWRIDINNLNISYPKLDINLNFNILEPVSLLRYMDTSSHKLFIESAEIDRNRFSSEKITPQVFDGRIGHIAVCEGGINKYKTTLGQKDYEIATKDGQLYYKYDFKISNIRASICEYERHGSLLFDSVDVQNINTLTVKSNYHVPHCETLDISYTVEQEDQATKVRIPKTSVEFNVLVETDISRALVPIMPDDIISAKKVYDHALNTRVNIDTIPDLVIGDMAMISEDIDPGNGGTYEYTDGGWRRVSYQGEDYRPLLFEHVVPDSVDHNESFGNVEYAPAQYTPRFLLDEEYDVKSGAHALAFNSEKLMEAGANYLLTTKRITISEYFMNDTHSIYYAPLLYNITDAADTVPGTKWVQAASDIYYIHYMDEDKKVHLALRTLSKEGLLVPFTGRVQGHIEMSSIDDQYKTPMIFDYTLGMI